MTTCIFHVSDVHFGVEDRRALDCVARAVAAEQPDALICTGDLTQRAKHSEYAAAQEWFASLGVPILLEPGNHDMPYYNLLERFSDPYRRYRALSGAVEGVLESDDLVFVSLKTTVRAQPRFPWSDGIVTQKALQETLGNIAALRDDPRSLIVTAHHPLLGPQQSRKNPTIGGQRAFATIAEAGADAIMTGHVHVPFDEIREVDGKSARMIGAGTLSTRLRHGAPPSYRVTKVEQGGVIESELRKLPAPIS